MFLWIVAAVLSFIAALNWGWHGVDKNWTDTAIGTNLMYLPMLGLTALAAYCVIRAIAY